MQLTLSIPAWDDVKCSKCGDFRKWNDGKGWHRRQCPLCTQKRALERHLRWRAANADAIREKERQRYAANRDAMRESKRRYRAANTEVVRKGRRNRRARKRNAICSHGPGCFAGAVASMPQRCAVPGCRRRKGLEADHIIPLAGGGLDCRDNLQMLCAYHNRSKGDADPTAWAQRNGQLL